MLVCVCKLQHVVLAVFKLSQCMQLVSLLSHYVELRIVQIFRPYCIVEVSVVNCFTE